MHLSAAINRIFYLFLVTTFITISLFGQYQNKVDGEGIKNIISVIASDAYMGRETGTEGCRMAEEYMAAEFKKLNLEPAGENNTYFLTYTFPFYRVDGDLDLTIGNRKFYYGRNEDYRVATYSDGGKVEGGIVFVGYGIISEDPNRNDFINTDIRGKVVLIRRGCPKNDWDRWKEAAIDSAKAAYCQKEGAVGILFFEPEQSQQAQMRSPRGDRRISNSLSKFYQLRNFPVFMVDERVARYILEDAEPGYNAMMRKIDTASISAAVNKTARMSVKATYDRERKTRDILGMIKGSDSKLSGELVMIGGHLDHIGIDTDGKINNGADDNASGPGVVLGIAQAMVKNEFRPKRSVIFAAWTGEEKGLLGSEAWCDKPTWDLDDVVVYFNLDMVGVGEVKLNLPGSYYADEVWKTISENTDSSILKNVTSSRGGPGGSDHTPFLQKGVPAMFGITGGSHPDYHQPGDDPDKIRSDILQFAGDFMYHSIDLIANSSKNFITENRNIIGKFKLATLFNLTPVGYNDYQKKLSSKEIDVSVVNFAEASGQYDPDRTFLTILRNADEALRSNVTSREFSFLKSPDDIRRLSYQNKIGLIGAINLSAIKYDELYAKILIKTGVKIGIVDRGAHFAQDSVDTTHTLKTIADGGMAILLNDLPTNELSNVLHQVEKPVGIISTDGNMVQLTEKDTEGSGTHLFIYRIHTANNIENIINEIDKLRKLWGDGNIALTIEEFDESSALKIQELYVAVEKKYNDNEFTNNIFSGNIRRFLQEAMEEKEETVSRGRPF